MCRWPLRAPTPLYFILWPIIDPILVTFDGQICNFSDPNLVTFIFFFYEFTYFLDWMKNTLLFIYSINILVRLLTVNMKNCLTPKNQKVCDPNLLLLQKGWLPVIIWTLGNSQRELKKKENKINRQPWYWSADILFWQLSIDHDMDVHYQVAGSHFS